jgi:hypothetical protein
MRSLSSGKAAELSKVAALFGSAAADDRHAPRLAATELLQAAAKNSYSSQLAVVQRVVYFHRGRFTGEGAELGGLLIS